MSSRTQRVSLPPKDGDPLIGAKNCLITPPTSPGPAAPRRARLIDITAANLQAFMAGQPVAKLAAYLLPVAKAVFPGQLNLKDGLLKDIVHSGIDLLNHNAWLACNP